MVSVLLLRSPAGRRCATAALALLPAAQSRRTVHLEGADCSQNSVQFGDLEVARAEQRVTVPFSVGALDVQPETNGGVKILRGSGRDYAITACIAASGFNRKLPCANGSPSTSALPSTGCSRSPLHPNSKNTMQYANR